jgi:hypothetical protein
LPSDRPWGDEYITDDVVPELLVAIFDQHQVMWCDSYRMNRRLRAHMVFMSGHFRRRANDMERATLRSGKMGVELLALTWLNIGYGSWQRCGFINKLEEIAMDTSAALGLSDAIHATERMLLAYAGGRRRSVSWTQRGMEEASTAALRTRWEWREAVTGGPYPLSR